MSAIRPPRLGRIGAIVPARNEQQLLPACLAALDAAAANASLPTTVIVVLDACSDNSAGVLARASWRSVERLIVLESDRGNVGYARRLGAAALLAEYRADELWLANTDADSVVPPDWFVRQLCHQARGAAAVLGTVEVADWSGHSGETSHRYQRNYRAVDGHRHTHGANLSLSATAYLAAGGFPCLAADEDVALTNRLIATGLPIAWAADLPVRTSARLVGRSPAGFAGHLRTLSAAVLARRPVLAVVENPEPAR